MANGDKADSNCNVPVYRVCYVWKLFVLNHIFYIYMNNSVRYSGHSISIIIISPYSPWNIYNRDITFHMHLDGVILLPLGGCFDVTVCLQRPCRVLLWGWNRWTSRKHISFVHMWLYVFKVTILSKYSPLHWPTHARMCALFYHCLG